jgi:hypothetical protein
MTAPCSAACQPAYPSRVGPHPRRPPRRSATQPAPEPRRVERRVSGRGALAVAGQRIHLGIAHAGCTLTVETADTTWRIYDADERVAEVARTTTKNIARFKVHKPELPRRRTAPVGGDTGQVS